MGLTVRQGEYLFVWRRALLFLLAITWQASSARAWAEEVPYVFLIQNSGWMEPFYNDNRSEKFDAAVAAFIMRAAPPSANIVIASFNKNGEIDGRTSPHVVYTGRANPSSVAGAVGRIDLPTRKDGRLANSDYAEALVLTLKNVVHDPAAVVFMVTNNKSAPNGREHPEDGPVIQRTEAFNTLLKQSPDISRIVAWPLRFAAHGKRFTERGLVIYGVAYGDDASEPLRAVSESSSIRQLLTDPPVRLKPLSFDPLELVLSPGKRGDLKWYTDKHGRIAIDGVSSKGDIIDMRGVLTNVHYPYIIRSGILVARWQTPRGTAIASRVLIKPSAISDLPPYGTVRNVTLKLAVSAVDRPTMFADQLKIPGLLTIELSDLKLGLAQEYVKKMHDIFGSGAAPTPDVPEDLPAQVPKIFIEYKTVNAARTEVPLSLIISFFPWPLILMGLGGAAAVAGLGFALTTFGRETPFPVTIDGEPRTIGLRAFQSKEIAGVHQTYIVERRAFGQPTVKPKTTKTA